MEIPWIKSKDVACYQMFTSSSSLLISSLTIRPISWLAAVVLSNSLSSVDPGVFIPESDDSTATAKRLSFPLVVFWIVIFWVWSTWFKPVSEGITFSIWASNPANSFEVLFFLKGENWITVKIVFYLKV